MLPYLEGSAIGSQSAEDQKGGAEVTLGSSVLTHLFLQMEKLRTREEKELTQSHTGG